jgi:predicted RecB family endonuclease
MGETKYIALNVVRALVEKLPPFDLRWPVEQRDQWMMLAGELFDAIRRSEPVSDLVPRAELDAARADVEALIEMCGVACDDSFAVDATQGNHYLTSLYDDMKRHARPGATPLADLRKRVAERRVRQAGGERTRYYRGIGLKGEMF